MAPSLAIGLWVVLAFVMAAIPSTDNHWRRAYVLMAIGVPALIWIFWQHGMVYGLLGLAVGCLVLRWPLIFFWRWVKRKADKGI